jgi:hypothetical protein
MWPAGGAARSAFEAVRFEYQSGLPSVPRGAALSISGVFRLDPHLASREFQFDWLPGVCMRAFHEHDVS